MAIVRETWPTTPQTATLAGLHTWTTLADATYAGDVAGGQATVTITSFQTVQARCDDGVSGADQAVEVTLGSFVWAAGSVEAGVLARASADGQNFYLFRAYQDSATGVYQVYRRLASTYAQIGSNIAQQPLAGDVLRIECVGDVITFKVNGTPVATMNPDATPVATGDHAGLWLHCERTNGSYATLDNWSVRDLPEPAVTTVAWLTPDIASADMVALFTTPTGWPTARRKVTTFKFYGGQVFDYTVPWWTGPPDPNVANTGIVPLTAADAFRKLTGWGLKTAVEINAISAAGKPANFESDVMLNCMANIAAAGGHTDYIDCDSTLQRGDEKSQTHAQTATELAGFCDRVLAVYPDVLFGDISFISQGGYTATTILDWVDLCLSAGVPLQWYTNDTGLDAPWIWTELNALSAGLLARGLEFRLIINPMLVPSHEATDASYCTDALARATTALAQLDPLPTVIEIQSWYQRTGTLASDIPINLPETTAGTMTKLVLDVAAVWSIADVGAPSPLLTQLRQPQDARA